MTDWISFCRLTFHAVLVSVCAFLAPPFPAAAEWHVKEAPIRFKLGLLDSPTHKSAGYFALLPDGGILPARPVTHVVTEAGKQLASYALWQSSGSGLALVFEDPGSSGDLYVYVTTSDKLNLWSPQSGLTPSPILCGDPRSGSLEAAKLLAKMGAVGPGIHYDRTLSASAPLVVEGDGQGRPPPHALYLLAYVETSDPGKTFVAPVTVSGTSEVRVDNQLVDPQKISNKPAGKGQWMNLSKGIHKVDIFAAADGMGDKPKNAVVRLSWRTARATVAELGGERPKDLPYPGTSMWESRMVRCDEIVKSGQCRLREINSRDGGPVACFESSATDIFWFEDTPPVYTYELKAVTAGNPADTQYTWSFGDAARSAGPKISWFLRGQKDNNVTLTALSGNKQSVCTVPVYAFAGVKSSMDFSGTRENFRIACLNVIRAYPPNADPTASWGPSVWRCFYDAQELGKGSALVAEVLTKRWDFFKSKVTPEKQMELEDIFFHWICHKDPDKAIAWLIDREKAWTSVERRNELKILQAEVFMYQRGNIAEAKKILAPLAQGAGESSARAMVRLGDAAFLEKNVNGANQCWGIVQNRAKTAKSVAEQRTGGIKWDAGSPDGKKKEKAEGGKEGFTAVGSAEKVDDWKKSAVVDTSMSSSVIALMAQGYYKEALQELRRWERNFPTSKTSGDYIVQEAKFYFTIGNLKRCRVLLEAYCKNVDASSYLAEAAELLLNCMIHDKEPDDVLKKFCNDMKKRFEFHPLAERMASLLQIIGADKNNREATIDRIIIKKR